MDETEEALLAEAYEVLNWRIELLTAAGYPERIAIILALRTDIDLHQATELLERGCKPKTALKILL